MNIKILLPFIFYVLNFQGLYSQNEAITTFGKTQGIVYDICFSKGGSLLIVPQNNNIHVYDTKTEKILFKLTGGHSKAILSVDISPDSSMIISGGKDSMLILWDLKSQKKIKSLNCHNGVVTSVKFHPTRKIIASGSSDNTIILYDFEKGIIIYKFGEHQGDISTLAFNSYGNLLASGSEDKQIIIWDTETGNMLNMLSQNKNYVREVSFSPDNTNLISCDDDAHVIVWDSKNVNEIKILNDIKLGTKWILSVCYHPGSKAYAAGGMDGKLRVITYFSKDSYNIKKPIHRILFKPNEGALLKMYIATRGAGVFVLDPSK